MPLALPTGKLPLFHSILASPSPLREITLVLSTLCVCMGVVWVCGVACGCVYIAYACYSYEYVHGVWCVYLVRCVCAVCVHVLVCMQAMHGVVCMCVTCMGFVCGWCTCRPCVVRGNSWPSQPPDTWEPGAEGLKRLHKPARGPPPERSVEGAGKGLGQPATLEPRWDPSQSPHGPWKG